MGKKKYLKKYWVKFPKFGERYTPAGSKAQSIRERENTKKATFRHITVKLLKIKFRENHESNQRKKLAHALQIFNPTELSSK